MSDTVIKVENLSKQYRLGLVGTGTLAHDLNRWWCRLRGKDDPYLKVGETNDRTSRSSSAYVWALRDVNFEVKRGEVLGIIGRNGAGKSTLLKILSRVTAPTLGSVKGKGRIAALLEVGTGFHPELTGRENVYLNGAINGMTRAEVARKLDEIVDFSGCERYIDTPVKRYSSGMTVRLGFAVAAHLEPEILIVDEVLAVGDAEFQKKCIGKMQDVAGHGRTVLFVSHNMSAISQLCSRCLFLQDGKMTTAGPPLEIIGLYLSTVKGNVLTPEDGPLRHVSIRQVDDGILVEAQYAFATPVRLPSLGIVVKNYLGVIIFGANPQTAGITATNPTTRGIIRTLIKQPQLRSGKYVVSFWLGDGVKDHVALIDAVSLDIVNVDDKRSTFTHEQVGSVYPECLWTIESHD